MSIAEKLTLIAENMKTIKDMGVGGSSASDNGFLIPYMNSVTFHSNISEVTELPDIIDLSSASTLIGFVDGKDINFEYIGIKISRLTSLQNAFRTNGTHTDKLKEIEIEGDTSTITTYINAFSGRRTLERIIGELNFSNSTTNSNTFLNCENLQEITISPRSIYKSIDFGSCTNLSQKSVTSIINGLADLSDSDTPQTFTFKGFELTDEEKGIISAKNWTLVN